MATINEFCEFMEEYLGEAVWARGGKAPSERLTTAVKKAHTTMFAGFDKLSKSGDSASASQGKKEREQGRVMASAGSKARSKIIGMKMRGSQDEPETYTTKRSTSDIEDKEPYDRETADREANGRN